MPDDSLISLSQVQIKYNTLLSPLPFLSTGAHREPALHLLSTWAPTPSRSPAVSCSLPCTLLRVSALLLCWAGQVRRRDAWSPRQCPGHAYPVCAWPASGTQPWGGRSPSPPAILPPCSSASPGSLHFAGEVGAQIGGGVSGGNRETGPSLLALKGAGAGGLGYCGGCSFCVPSRTTEIYHTSSKVSK